LSDLFASGSSGALILGIAALGLSSTLHCASMCGGLVLLCCQDPGDRLRYQMGRLLGYLGAWALLFSLGRNLFRGEAWITLQSIAWITVGILLAVQLLQVFGLRSSSAFSGLNRALGKFGAHLRRRMPGPLYSGFFSVLLPCGVLYTALLSALGTGQLLLGASLILVFWLCSVPGLLAAPALAHAFAKHAGGRRIWARGALIFGVACFWMAFRLDAVPISTSTTNDVSCHSLRPPPNH
jgi:sulfite exporter TauE/SafE